MERELPDEISGFGVLSFLKKVDIAAPQDAILGRLLCREGDFVRSGATVAILENPQITLAVGRAENAYTQAAAAMELAGSRLLEGKFQAEAQILSLEKGEAELVQARRSYDEQSRKHQDQERLYAAGGLSEEAILGSRFALENTLEQIRLMERELEIRRVGTRDRDLAAAGVSFDGENDGGDRVLALIRLSTATLRAELQAARAQLEAAAKELESARLAQAELTVVSPAGGTVGARYLEEGERVKREDKLLTLMDTGALYALFPVPEADALRLRKDMAASIRVDGTGGVYEGTVDLVSPQADSQSFTFTVRVLLPRDEGGLLKPGMFARAAITLGPPRKSPVIPESSIINKKNDEGTVFVIRGSQVAERQIHFGASLGEDREILSGLVSGEVVVTRPDTGLRDGAYVSLK
jgi:multidrug efflux pump subunit AcrA (membrane-fusion protein)